MRIKTLGIVLISALSLFTAFYWVTDPAGIAWESFHSLGSIPMFGAEADSPAETKEQSGCCAPEPATVAMPKTKRAACCG